MLTENKFGKYLTYAIGEIVLVVIGILIALQINNWNELEKNKEKEHKYLINLNNEIINDSIFLERSWFRNRNKKIEYLKLAKQYAMGNYIPKDTIQFINNVGFGGINSRASFLGISRTYNELINTGNLSLILNDSLRERIVIYYADKNFAKDYINGIRSDYATYCNALKVFDSKFPDKINTVEIPRILEKMKSDEFHSLINLELTYSYSIERPLQNNKQSAYHLNKIIEEYIKK